MSSERPYQHAEHHSRGPSSNAFKEARYTVAHFPVFFITDLSNLIEITVSFDKYAVKKRGNVRPCIRASPNTRALFCPYTIYFPPLSKGAGGG